MPVILLIAFGLTRAQHFQASGCSEKEGAATGSMV